MTDGCLCSAWQARYGALVRWEVHELEKFAGSPTYLLKEECNVGVVGSFLIGHRGARPSLMDPRKRGLITPAIFIILADLWNTLLTWSAHSRWSE